MNPNTGFERFTQRIYQKLVNNDVLRPTTVQHNVKLKGIHSRSWTFHSGSLTHWFMMVSWRRWPI